MACRAGRRGARTLPMHLVDVRERHKAYYHIQTVGVRRRHRPLCPFIQALMPADEARRLASAQGSTTCRQPRGGRFKPTSRVIVAAAPPSRTENGSWRPAATRELSPAREHHAPRWQDVSTRQSFRCKLARRSALIPLNRPCARPSPSLDLPGAARAIGGTSALAFASNAPRFRQKLRRNRCRLMIKWPKEYRYSSRVISMRTGVTH
jgi:hypothetical protein